MKKILEFFSEIIEVVILALIIVFPIRYFLFQPFIVKGQSMEPNFEDGDYLIIDEISFRFREPKRGEVVVFKSPQNLSQRYIKRIIGLPGETVEIEDGKIIIFNQDGSKILNETEYLSPQTKTPGNLRISLKANEYFVLGDNRWASFDSRNWGPLPKKNIIGRVYLRAWPFAALTKFEAPKYP